jgi:hypothetical protein
MQLQLGEISCYEIPLVAATILPAFTEGAGNPFLSTVYIQVL